MIDWKSRPDVAGVALNSQNSQNFAGGKHEENVMPSQ